VFLKSIDEKKTNSKGFISENNFEDKIVFVGVTATSMYDIKSTPISKNTPGIEFQATTFLNLMENNFIHKASFMTNLLSSFILVMLIGTAILFFDSAFVSIITSFLLLSSYFAAAVALYTYQHLWIDMVFPFLAAIFVRFSCMFQKCRQGQNFDYTYKLATSKGLSGLFNHRYMQEEIAIKLQF
jgi:CHASE2 domain-containing sensor protein